MRLPSDLRQVTHRAEELLESVWFRIEPIAFGCEGEEKLKGYYSYGKIATVIIMITSEEGKNEKFIIVVKVIVSEGRRSEKVIIILKVIEFIFVSG